MICEVLILSDLERKLIVFVMESDMFGGVVRCLYPYLAIVCLLLDVGGMTMHASLLLS